MTVSSYVRATAAGCYLALAAMLAGCGPGNNAGKVEYVNNCTVEGSSRLVTVKEPEGGIGAVVSKVAGMAGVVASGIDREVGNVVAFQCPGRGRIELIVISYEGDQLKKGELYNIGVKASQELGQNKVLTSAKQASPAQSTPAKK